MIFDVAYIIADEIFDEVICMSFKCLILILGNVELVQLIIYYFK